MSVEINVLSSQAIKEAYLAFQPEFERTSGHKLNTAWFGTVDAVRKLRAGEVFDAVILVSPSMDEMIKEGKIVPESRVDLVRSEVAIAVPAGAPKPPPALRPAHELRLEDPASARDAQHPRDCDPRDGALMMGNP